MRKGYTVIDVLIIVVILGVLATVAIPAYRMIVRHSQLREVRNLVELTRAGARYYSNKHGITAIDPSKGQPAVWNSLRIDLPASPYCTYQITSPNATTRRLEVTRNSDGALLYTYDLPNGPGAVQATTDARYLNDLPP